MVTAAGLADVLSALSRVDADVSDGERVEQLAALERVKAAAAAAQARITVDLLDSQEQLARAWRERARAASDAGDFEGWQAAREQARRATADDGSATAGSATDGNATNGRAAASGAAASSRRRAGEALGVAGQVALARRESPSRGARHLATAIALVRHMPHTFAALQAGAISEWRAWLLVRETALLTPEQRTAVDVEVAGRGGAELGSLGDRELLRRVQAVGYRIDPACVMARVRGAVGDRRVTIRPAPDTMSLVSAFLPVAQGVAVHAALTAAAAAAKAAGDHRSKGQLMADTLVTRLTGQASADAVPLEVHLVISDRSLLAGDETPAQLPGYGTVPAGWARDLLTQPGTDGDQAPVWLRRLYTHPSNGTLVAMDSTRRVFDGGLRRYLLARDGTCRTPWCDAPIRHLDHVTEHAKGGATSARNGQGLCVRCNHTKALTGWRARVVTGERDGEHDPPGRHTVATTTPTGHVYTSNAPPVLAGHRPEQVSQLERQLELILAA